jgi:hypothetical protein
MVATKHITLGKRQRMPCRVDCKGGWSHMLVFCVLLRRTLPLLHHTRLCLRRWLPVPEIDSNGEPPEAHLGSACQCPCANEMALLHEVHKHFILAQFATAVLVLLGSYFRRRREDTRVAGPQIAHMGHRKRMSRWAALAASRGSQPQTWEAAKGQIGNLCQLASPGKTSLSDTPR